MAASSSEAVKPGNLQQPDEIKLRYEETAKQVTAKLEATLQQEIELCKSKMERVHTDFVASSKQHIKEAIQSMNNQLKVVTKPLKMFEVDRNTSEHTMSDIKEINKQCKKSDWKTFPLVKFVRKAIAATTSRESSENEKSKIKPISKGKINKDRRLPEKRQ